MNARDPLGHGMCPQCNQPFDDHEPCPRPRKKSSTKQSPEPAPVTVRFRKSLHHSGTGSTAGFESIGHKPYTHHAWGVPLDRYVDLEENGIAEVTIRVIKHGKDTANPWRRDK
jgi:hypothetical protein